LQLAKPDAQALTAQLPLTQTAPALARLHARPHAPQFETSAEVRTSQPSASLPLQLAKPVSHAPTRHAPSTHDAAAFDGRQSAPQAPQCAVVVRRLVSQPFEGSPSQSPKPRSQVRAQAPPRQAAVALEPPGQAREHEPQAVGSASSAPQRPEQKVVPPLHTLLHAPIEQAVPVGQRLPQRPQLELSADVGVSQAPAEHAATPLAKLHARPHIPQFATAVCVFTSQPLSALPSQLSKPAAQVERLQSPAPHDALPLG
jgi:hypothetical protein